MTVKHSFHDKSGSSLPTIILFTFIIAKVIYDMYYYLRSLRPQKNATFSWAGRVRGVDSAAGGHVHGGGGFGYPLNQARAAAAR